MPLTLLASMSMSYPRQEAHASPSVVVTYGPLLPPPALASFACNVREGDTIGIAATRGGHRETLEVCLESGVPFAAKNNRGRCARLCVQYQAPRLVAMTPLLASRRNRSGVPFSSPGADKLNLSRSEAIVNDEFLAALVSGRPVTACTTVVWSHGRKCSRGQFSRKCFKLFSCSFARMSWGCSR